jgi:site-specific recombinase XerD
MITAGDAKVTHMEDFIAGFIRHCRQKRLAKTTLADREEVLRRMDDELPMGLVRATTEEIGDWLANDKWKPKTSLTYYEHVVVLFKWLVKRELIDYDPTSGLARPKVYPRTPRPVKEWQFAQILENTTGFWRLAAELAGLAGLRACEIATIHREEIDVNNLIVLGKGGVEKPVPTHERIWQSVRNFPAGSLAKTTLGREVSANYVSQTFPRKVAEATGLTGMGPHRLRARFITILLTPRELGGAGYDLRTAQTLARHATPGQTAAYHLLVDGQRRLAIDALPVPISSTPC